MFDGGLLVLVQMDLDQLRTVQLDADALSDDLGREDQILEDGVVHGGQGTGTRTLLLVRVTTTALGLGQDATLADEHDVLAGELLLQLTDQPGLDLLEGLLLGHRHVDDDGLKPKQKSPLVPGRNPSTVHLLFTFLLLNSISRARVMWRSRSCGFRSEFISSSRMAWPIWPSNASGSAPPDLITFDPKTIYQGREENVNKKRFFSVNHHFSNGLRHESLQKTVPGPPIRHENQGLLRFQRQHFLAVPKNCQHTLAQRAHVKRNLSRDEHFPPDFTGDSRRHGTTFQPKSTTCPSGNRFRAIRAHFVLKITTYSEFVLHSR